jgi:Uma2 family endonuclease
MLQRVVRRSRRRQATYDDLAAVPAGLVAELIDGRLHTSPRPMNPHAMAASTLGALLAARFHLRDAHPGGWILLDEPELHLGEDVVVPDIAGWRRTRVPRLEDTYCATPPDWVCEILSPSTERLDRLTKLRVYARVGVGHAWLIDPIARTLEVMTREGARWTMSDVHARHERVRAAPFDAVAIPLSHLWDETPPQG